MRANGKAYCWGYNYYGQVGDGTSGTNRLSPVRVGTFEDWRSVSAGPDYHSCGVRANGKAYCWGSNETGEIGDATNGIPRLSPVRVGTFEDWAGISAGANHSCGVRANGKAYCWGNNYYGQIGDGTSGTNRLSPVRVGTDEDWKSVSAGESHSCGVRFTGKLYCWGRNNNGQIGDGTSGTNSFRPTRIGFFADWKSVSAGDSHTCGVRTNGKLYCWGNNDDGQIGDDVAGTPTPFRVGTFADWKGVDAGGLHSCGFRANGKLYCWGKNSAGQVGDGTSGTNRFAPTRV